MPAPASNFNYVGKAELHSAIHQQLRNDGIFNEITTTIRSRILQSLLKDNASTEDATPTKDFTRNHQDMAFLSLLYHYFKQKGMEHTLSVFASESRMEHSLKYPLSPVGAIKALGLEIVWNEYHSKEGNDDGVQIELLLLLQAVAQWVLTQQEKDADAELQSSKGMNHLQVSKSVQTDKGMIPWASNRIANGGPEYDKENSHANHGNMEVCNQKGHGANKPIEQRLMDIERECEHRMRQEMNDKLRLSAKKQAAIATRRLEQKHKESLRSLRHQIELERTQARHRQEELSRHLSEQKLMAQKESKEKEQMLQTILLDKQSLQSEMGLLNERVKEMQQRRFQEWTNEHETLARAHNQSMADLEEQRRHLQKQSNEVSLQKDAMRAKEAKMASLEQDRDNLIIEMQNLRHQQSKSLTVQQSSFEQAQTDLQTAETNLEVSRAEVKGLRTLMKQTQGALQSVSFRELGKASVNSMNTTPVIYNRNVLEQRATPNFEDIVRSCRQPSLAAATLTNSPPRIKMQQQMPSNNAMISDANRVTTQLEQRATPNLEAIVRPFRHPSLVAVTSTNPHSRIEIQQHMSSNNAIISDSNPKKQETTADIISNERKSLDVQPVVPEDPPCSSAEDPPEMTEKNIDNVNLDCGSYGRDAKEYANIQGKGIILNLSAITEGAQSETYFAAASILSHGEEDASARSPQTKSAGQDMAKKEENINEQGTEEIQVCDAQPIYESSPELIWNEESPKVESKISATSESNAQFEELLQSDINSEAEDVKPASANAQITTASIASEAQYSESFHTFNVSQGSIHALPHKPDRDCDSSPKQIIKYAGDKVRSAQPVLPSNHSPERPSSASSAESSSGYSESFCSDEK